MTNSDLYQKRIVGILSRIDPIFEKYGLDPQLKTVFSKENLQELPIFSYVKSTTKALLNGLSDLTMIGIYLLFLLKIQTSFHLQNMVSVEKYLFRLIDIYLRKF